MGERVTGRDCCGDAGCVEVVYEDGTKYHVSSDVISDAHMDTAIRGTTHGSYKPGSLAWADMDPGC